MNRLIALGIMVLIQGCSSVPQHRGETVLNPEKLRLVLAPYHNATDDEHAGRALTELTGTALAARGLSLQQTEQVMTKSEDQDDGSLQTGYLQKAREMKATHIVLGTVHEYHYKTDLNANPAVGITIRLVDVDTGQTVWQGSTGKVGYAFASLTSTAQRAVRELVSKMPFSKGKG